MHQALRQRGRDGGEGITDFGHDEGKEAGFAAAEGGDEGEQAVEVFLGAGLEFVGFERDAGHDVDERAGDVEDFFDLGRGFVLVGL